MDTPYDLPKDFKAIGTPGNPFNTLTVQLSDHAWHVLRRLQELHNRPAANILEKVLDIGLHVPARAWA